jgi:ribonuclease HI
MASLDVQKAYDSVPFQSIEQSLKRIKVPTQFINQVRKILTRKVFIESPAGRTNIFSAERGLPQGDPMSPILWNIFYDELLTNLQSKIGYKLYHTINISVLAYADDIHPISHRKEVLQDMLADIELFLKSHKMSLNATKSKILTNDDQSNYEFKINQQTIQLVPKTELVRILGVYWSMDGNYKATIKKTMTELINQIVAIQYKFIPGKIMTHLINTVIIPTIKYRLQYIPISDNQLEKVDKRLRSLTRLKNKLPPTTKNDYIYCNEFGIKLFSIKNIHKNTIITDLTVFLRNDNITSKVIRAVLEKLRLKMRFPLPLINKPVKLQNNSFIKYVINLFHRENLSIKQTHVGQFEQILLEMPLEDYISGRKIMFDLNLSNLQLPSNKQLLLSFNDLTNHWPRLKKAIFDKVPNWYQFIMQKMSNCQDDYSQQFNYRIPIYIKEEQETIYKIPEEKTELEIWTDGSLKKESNKMGAGFLIWDTQENIIHKQSIKVDSQNPSSTKAELIGILAALDICHTNQTIRIYTDSQCAINGCKNILVKESSRTELKYKNLYILEQIKAVMLQFSKIPTFIKVAGHSNLLKNDQADELAKLGAESSLENYQVGIGSVKEYLFKNNTIVNGYPNQFLKKIRQEKQFGLIETNLNEKWEFSDIDWKDTLKVCYQGMNLENALDATDVKEQSFRIRFFSKKLPVLSLVKKWNYNNNTYTENSICPRCKKEEETLQHLITCDKNKTISSKLYNTTIESINERLNTNPTYKNLKEQHFKPSKKHLMYLLGFQNFQEFTTLPSAYGLINQTLIDRFKKTKRTKNHTKLWIQLVLDSWLTTVYKIIWTERCKDLKQSQEQNHQNKRKSNSEHHTIKKIKLINYSKISLFTSLAEHPKKINLSTSKILPKPIMLITSHARNPQKIRLKPKIRSRVTSQRNKPRTTTTYIDSSPLTNNLTSKRTRKQTGHYEQDHFKKIKLKLGSPQKISIKLKIPPDKTMNDRGEDPMSAMVSMVGAEDEEGGEGPRFNETVGSV